MKTNIHFLSYPVQQFLERKVFQTKVSEENRNNFMLNKFFFEIMP
jgi:hypothetical protein